MTHVGYEDHPLLPASAPEGQAHILEYDGCLMRSIAEIKLCDFVATLLSKLDKYPDALKDFFDPDIKYFHLVRKYKPGHKSCMTQFMISRKKNRVVCGFFTIIDEGRQVWWEVVTKNRLSEVAPDATWKTTWGARVALSNPPIEPIWQSTFHHVNRPDYTYENPCIAKVARKVAYDFGSGLYKHAHWDLDEQSEFILETKK